VVLAVVNVVAVNSITRETRLTFTGEAANGICACGILVTVVGVFVTFIDIDTFSVLEFETRITDTCWSIVFFYTGTTGAAIVIFAVIDVTAVYSITRETSFTFTGETTWCIGTGGILVAVVGFFIAFIDICACLSISIKAETSFTGACV